MSPTTTSARQPGNHRPTVPVACLLMLLAGCGDQPADAAPSPAAPATGDAAIVAPAAPLQDPSPQGPASRDPQAGHRRMLELLQDVARRTADEHHYQGDRIARELRAELARLGDQAPWKLHQDLGLAELQLGNERAALDVLTRAHAELAAGRMAGGAPALRALDFHLAIAWLRLAETENCCATPSPESCILPLRDGAIHRQREGSQRAIPHLLSILEQMPPGDYWHLACRWLLNLAHMTLGTWPDGVPEAHRLPAAAFTATQPLPRLRNVAPDLGLDTFSLSGGAIVDDFDGDDHLDIVVSTWDTHGQTRLFRNNGDGTFTDRTEAAGLTGLLGGLNLKQADFDNDGHLDFLVLRGAWLFEHGRHPNSLVRNNGDGTFTDVTFAAGLGAQHFPTQTAEWADYDRDGDLDLYIGNESSQRARFPSQLFRNNGDGTFTDVAAPAGVQNFGFAKGVTWGDHDGDGWPDLYVSNIGGPNRLYRNRGDGTFEDVAPRLGVTGPEASFPTWFWDFDNDGVLDLYVAAYCTGIGHIAAHHLGIPQQHERAKLYRGDGHGGFRDVAREMGLTYPAMPMGSNFGDLDNDGWLDCYLGTGDPQFYSLMPNLLFHNQGGKGFVDATMATGMGHLQKGHGVAFADLDHDGDQDVFEQMGGAYLGDRAYDALYENPGNGNRWLTVHLVGTRSNRSAIGARIRVDLADGDGTRSVFRHVNSGGSFGANPLRQTIGLGTATAIRRLEIRWPRTGTTQVLATVPMDRAIRIVEGTDGLQVLELVPFTLGRR